MNREHAPSVVTISVATRARNAVQWRAFARAISLAALFAALTAASAHVRFPIPGTPVPVTLQTLSVVLAGMALGPRFGTLSMIFYLMLGLTGYDVLASTPAAGRWFPPTAGYLLGFVAAQPIVGWMSVAFARRQVGESEELARDTRLSPAAEWLRLAAAPIAGHVVIFVLGVIGLAIADQLSLSVAVQQGLLPFVPGTIVKVLAAMFLGRAAVPLCRRWLRS